MSRGAFYVRVSAVMGRDPDEFHSPDLQLRAMRAYAGREGIEETVTLPPDIDRTGRNFSREGVQEAFERARHGEYDTLVVYDLSRFGRNTAESLQNIRDLRDLGVRVVSTKEQFDDSPEGQFQLTLFLSLAELYSGQMSRRWAELVVHRAEQGYAHGSPPLGYRRAGKGLPMEPDPELAPHVQAAFRDYAAGKSATAITRDLSRVRDVDMSSVVILRMLENVAYIGMARLKIGDEWRAFDGLHEPLVTPELWKRVQARRDRERGLPSKRQGDPVHPLVGLLRCAECDKPLVFNHGTGARRQSYNAYCPKQIRQHNCPGCGAVNADRAHEWLLEQVSLWHLGEASGFSAQADRERAEAEREQQRDELAAAVKELEGALGNLAAQLARGLVGEAAYAAGSAELERELAERRAELRTLMPADVPDDLLDRLGVTGQTWLERVRAVGEAVASGAYEALAVPDQSRLLRSVVRSIAVAKSAERNNLDRRLDIAWE